MGKHNSYIKTVLMTAGIIEMLAGLAHFAMPHFVYQPKGFSFLTQNEKHFIALGIFAVGILLIAFGILTILFSLKVDIKNELLFFYTIIKSFLWFARIILEILYPVKIPLFLMEQPTIVFMPLLILACMLFVSAAFIISYEKKHQILSS